MSDLVVAPYYDRHKRREAIKQVLQDDGADGSEWAINAIEKSLTGSDLELKVNHKVMRAFFDSCKASKKTIAKRVLASEYMLECWCKEDSDIELWRLKVLATFTRKYNWLVFFLDDVKKLP